MASIQAKWILLGVGIVAIACVTLIVVLGLLSKGPGPGEGLFDVQLTNDTSEQVVVQTRCLVDVPPCDYKTYRTLKPGASAPVRTSEANVDAHYRVVDSSGRVLGCLALRYRRVEEGATVKLSEELGNCS
jgi:hypothetical protein